MATFGELMTGLADEIRTITATSDTFSVSDMTSELTTINQQIEDLKIKITEVLSQMSTLINTSGVSGEISYPEDSSVNELTKMINGISNLSSALESFTILRDPSTTSVKSSVMVSGYSALSSTGSIISGALQSPYPWQFTVRGHGAIANSDFYIPANYQILISGMQSYHEDSKTGSGTLGSGNSSLDLSKSMWIRTANYNSNLDTLLPGIAAAYYDGTSVRAIEISGDNQAYFSTLTNWKIENNILTIMADTTTNQSDMLNGTYSIINIGTPL